MKTECQINNFWRLDAAGIAENETSIYENFNRKIESKDGRYSIELPVKESHPMLPDNYTLSEKRLENLKRRLDGDEEKVRKYEKVFREQLDCSHRKDRRARFTWQHHILATQRSVKK